MLDAGTRARQHRAIQGSELFDDGRHASLSADDHVESPGMRANRVDDKSIMTNAIAGG